jgi:hypothetical protein
LVSIVGCGVNDDFDDPLAAVGRTVLVEEIRVRCVSSEAVVPVDVESVREDSQADWEGGAVSARPLLYSTHENTQAI